MNIKYLNELETDTTINWWNSNRIKINDVIKIFNEWQTEHDFSEKHKKILLARIEALKEYGKDHSFSEWQFIIINEMEEHSQLPPRKRDGLHLRMQHKRCETPARCRRAKRADCGSRLAGTKGGELLTRLKKLNLKNLE